MKRFVEGTDRGQSTLLPECLEDWIGEDNPVRVIDVFVEELDLGELGFGGVEPEATGRPSYHPSVLLKLYIYGYLNRVQSSRRLEREAGHNVEVMWLSGRLVPDHKTIADFRKDNGIAIRKVCARFVALCRTMGLLTQASVAIDGSKFKAVNNRDRNFTRAKSGWKPGERVIDEVIYRTRDRYQIRPNRRGYIGVVHRTTFSLWVRRNRGRIRLNRCRRFRDDHRRSGESRFKTVSTGPKGPVTSRDAALKRPWLLKRVPPARIGSEAFPLR